MRLFCVLVFGLVMGLATAPLAPACDVANARFFGGSYAPVFAPSYVPSFAPAFDASCGVVGGTFAPSYGYAGSANILLQRNFGGYLPPRAFRAPRVFAPAPRAFVPVATPAAVNVNFFGRRGLFR